MQHQHEHCNVAIFLFLFIIFWEMLFQAATRRVSLVRSVGGCRVLSTFSGVRAQGEVMDGAVPMGAEFVANMAHMDKLLERHNALIQHIVLGGGERAQGKLKKRGKIFVRQR